MTVDEAVMLLGKECISKEIFTDEYMREHYLHLLTRTIEREGRERCVRNKKMMYYAWDYVRTLMQEEMALTLDDIVKLVGKENVPKEVFDDPEIRKEYLRFNDEFIKERGEQWVIKHKGLFHSEWEIIISLL